MLYEVFHIPKNNNFNLRYNGIKTIKSYILMDNNSYNPVKFHHDLSSSFSVMRV